MWRKLTGYKYIVQGKLTNKKDDQPRFAVRDGSLYKSAKMKRMIGKFLYL